MNRLRFTGPGTRYVLVTAALVGVVGLVSRRIRRSYGGHAACRFAGAALGVVAAQQAVVAIVLRRRPNPRGLSLVDCITLSRATVSAVLLGLIASGVRDRRGPAGWLAWCSVVYGAIVCDWLDGPLARRTRTSEAGSVLDLEADSWLTLGTGTAATSWGELARVAAFPALLRYPLFFDVVRRTEYARATAGDPPWARRMGIAQMALYLAALAPFGGRATKSVVRVIAPIETVAQSVGLVVLYRRKVHS